MTTLNGTNGTSGMEYCMIVNNPSANNRGRSVDVTVHVIAHIYFPFAPDLKIESVQKNVILLKKKGTLPVPVVLQLIYDDGTTERLRYSAVVCNMVFEKPFHH